mmetsp:Transcript_20161/g.44155  ORF Transcript_20161/g.44155 Transcript_20161/m.44155 type:complete len:221 (+) Transcript_20161:153-815(+)
MKLTLVFIPGLMRHLATGWTEDQLISGRIHTIGKEVITIELQEASTLLQVAQAVEDRWGVPIEDMAFRFKGQTLTASKHGKKKLKAVGVTQEPLCTFLLSAGEPKQAQRKTLGGAGGALCERDPTQVITTTIDPDAPPTNPTNESTVPSTMQSQRQAVPQGVHAFSGRSYSLSSATSYSKPSNCTKRMSSSGSAEVGTMPSLEQRRALALRAALSRANPN